MKKRLTVLLVCLLAMGCLLPVGALSENADQILTAEPWTGMAANSGIFTLEAGGGGTLALDASYVLPLTWSAQGDQVTVVYELYGTRSYTYTLGRRDGFDCLMTQEGGVLLRVSNRDALLAAQSENLNAYAVRAGETLRLGFVNLTLDGLWVGNEIPVGNSVKTSAGSGKRFVGISGTIENPGGVAINADNLCVEVKLDGQYIYMGQMNVENNNVMNQNVDPMQKTAFHMTAQVPTAVADSFKTCAVTFGFMDGMLQKPLQLSGCSFVFKLESDPAAADAAREKEMVFFEHSPAMPDPVSFLDVKQVGSNVSKSNGKISRMVYRYSPFDSSVSTQQVLKDYLACLEQFGLRVDGQTVYADSVKLAEISVDGDKVIVNLMPGNENVEAVFNAPQKKPLSMGEVVKTANAEMTLEQYGQTDRIYSSITKSSSYTYYESQTGDPFFYLYGTFHNLGSKPVDIRNIYAEFVFDGEYHYPAKVAGVRKGASQFISDVNAQTSVEYYVYGDVPASVLNSFSSCVIQLGFTKDYSTKVVSAGGLNIFGYCDEVVEILIGR